MLSKKTLPNKQLWEPPTKALSLIQEGMQNNTPTNDDEGSKLKEIQKCQLRGTRGGGRDDHSMLHGTRAPNKFLQYQGKGCETSNGDVICRDFDDDEPSLTWMCMNCGH